MKFTNFYINEKILPNDTIFQHKSAVSATKLIKRYTNLTALNAIDFNVKSGNIFCILGPNGAGKSTLFELCAGLNFPDEGKIEIFGTTLNKKALTKIKQFTGIMPQTGGSYPSATIKEILKLIASYYKNPYSIDWLIDTLGLMPVAKTSYRKLSFGQKQRLAFAGAIVGKPKLIFLDEPTTGLDPEAKEKLINLIKSLNENGATILLSTHDINEAEKLADDLMILKKGKIKVLDKLTTLVDNAQNQIRFNAKPNISNDNFIKYFNEANYQKSYTISETRSGCYLLKAKIESQLIELIAKWSLDPKIATNNIQINQNKLFDIYFDAINDSNEELQ